MASLRGRGRGRGREDEAIEGPGSGVKVEMVSLTVSFAMPTFEKVEIMELSAMGGEGVLSPRLRAAEG